MQYLLVDTHQRFLGTFDCEKALGVGDTFQNQHARTYAVIGTHWFKQSNNRTQALTVIPVNRAAKKAEQN